MNKIGAELPLEPVAPNYKGEVATRYRYLDGTGEIGVIAKRAQLHFFKLAIDDLPNEGRQYQAIIKNKILTGDWAFVYDLVEWFANWGEGSDNWLQGNRGYDNAIEFRTAVNEILTKEHSAYRFVGKFLSEIHSESEVQEVNLIIGESEKFSPVSKHIQSAVALMSNRENPDFRNSIKESISAVEAVAKIISGNPKTTLNGALKVLEKSGIVHGSLKVGFSKLYGWTSDAQGIRHALMDESKISLADARYMLVACSAFANYLISNYEES